MSKYIVSVFDNNKGAYGGAQVLRQLDAEGSIAVYEGAIISKNKDGAVRVEDAAAEGPIGALSGMLLGSLIGVIGGPAGVLAGAAGGSFGGLMVDLHKAGVNDEFLDDVAKKLSPGKYAVVADIDEAWTTPLDARMEAAGSKVFRSWRIDVEDEQIERDIEATNRELDELDEEWKQAKGEAKASMQAKIDTARGKLKALDERAKKKVEALKSQAEAKINKLDQQIAKASADFKTKLKKSRDELKADYGRRVEKLEQAGKLAAEAVS